MLCFGWQPWLRNSVATTFTALLQGARDEIDLLQDGLRGGRLKAEGARQEVAEVSARLEAVSWPGDDFSYFMAYCGSDQ